MALKLSLSVSLVLALLACESTSKSVITTEEIYSPEILNATDTEIRLDFLPANLPNISGVADSILKGGEELLNVVEELQDKTKKIYVEQIRKTERILLQLQQGIDKLDEKHKTFAAEAMGLVFDVKTTLRITRTDLNGIARRLVSGMDELKALAQAIFSGEVTDEDEINTILNWNVVAASNMIKEGQKKVDQAQKDYENVGEKLASIKEKLKQYKQFIDAIVNSEHAQAQKHNTDGTIARGSIYGTCATSTTVCIFVDIFGAFGACSAINAGTCLGLIGSMETAIAVFKGRLEYFNGQASKAQETVREVLQDQKLLLDYFIKEKNTLDGLDVALSATEQNVDRSKDLFFINIPSLRSHYLASLDKLKQAAQDYLDQPELEI